MDIFEHDITVKGNITEGKLNMNYPFHGVFTTEDNKLTLVLSFELEISKEWNGNSKASYQDKWKWFQEQKDVKDYVLKYTKMLNKNPNYFMY